MPLRLKKRGEVYHYSGTVAGRRLRGSTKTSLKDEAERFVNDLERRTLKGDRDPGEVLTFAQASIEYRKVHGEPRYLVMVEDYWRDTLVKNITRGALKRAAVTILPTAKGAYRNRAVIVPTSAVINFAASLELCPPFRPERFPETKAVRDPATWQWVQAFMVEASPHLGALAAFMFLTGARISEALAVKWRHVDFGAATARIKMGKLGGQERIAHMPPELVAALANVPSNREGDDLVFGYAGAGSCKDPWHVAIKRAGIRRLTPHSCRHGFATTLLHAGIDPITVAKLGGWKDPQQLFRTYGHAMDDDTVTNILTGRRLTHGVKTAI